jgi:N-methylhydantoinase A
MLVADQSYDFQLPVLKNLDEIAPGELPARAAELEALAAETLRASGLDMARVQLRRRADCRYLGQAESLAIDLPGGRVDDGTIAALQSAFEGEHRRQWNFVHRERPVTLMNLRLQAVALTATTRAGSDERARGAAKPHHERRLFLEGERVTLPVYLRDTLRPGHDIVGPGLVEEASSSLVFPKDRRVAVDEEGNLIVKRAG